VIVVTSGPFSGSSGSTSILADIFHSLSSSFHYFSLLSSHFFCS